MSTRNIATFKTNGAEPIEVVALVNNKGDATSYRVFEPGFPVKYTEHKTAKRAIKAAADLALLWIYDHEACVNA